MANVLHRTTLEYRRSVNDPEYADPPWLVVPPGSGNADLIATVERKYLSLSGDVLSEMSRGEKDAVDAAELEASRDSAAAQFDAVEDVFRAFTLALLDELNGHADKINAVLDASDAAISLADFKARVAAIADYPQRSVAQMKTAIRSKLGS